MPQGLRAVSATAYLQASDYRREKIRGHFFCWLLVVMLPDGTGDHARRCKPNGEALGRVVTGRTMEEDHKQLRLTADTGEGTCARTHVLRILGQGTLKEARQCIGWTLLCPKKEPRVSRQGEREGVVRLVFHELC